MILGTFDFEPEHQGRALFGFFVRVAKLLPRPVEQPRISLDRDQAESVGEELVVEDGSVVVDEDFLDRHRRNFRDQDATECVGDAGKKGRGGPGTRLLLLSHNSEKHHHCIIVYFLSFFLLLILLPLISYSSFFSPFQ